MEQMSTDDIIREVTLVVNTLADINDDLLKLLNRLRDDTGENDGRAKGSQDR